MEKEDIKQDDKLQFLIKREDISEMNKGNQLNTKQSIDKNNDK